MQPQSLEPKKLLLNLWVIWIALLVGTFLQFHFLGGGAPRKPDEFPWFIPLLPLAVSVVVRWRLLPRMKNPVQILPLFVIGIAMAESTMFLGLYLTPSYKMECFIAAVLGIFQFIPLFARRLLFPNE